MSKIKKIFLFIPHSFKKLFNFLKDVRTEMKDVKWPTFKEMRNNTFVVIFISLIVMLYFLGLDYIIEFVKGLFNK